MYLSIYLEDIVMTISRLWKIPTTRTGILSALPRIIKVSTDQSETAIQIRPYKEYISIKITPFLNRYISYGNTYTHTHKCRTARQSDGNVQELGTDGRNEYQQPHSVG